MFKAGVGVAHQIASSPSLVRAESALKALQDGDSQSGCKVKGPTYPFVGLFIKFALKDAGGIRNVRAHNDRGLREDTGKAARRALSRAAGGGSRGHGGCRE